MFASMFYVEGHAGFYAGGLTYVTDV